MNKIIQTTLASILFLLVLSGCTPNKEENTSVSVNQTEKEVGKTDTPKQVTNLAANTTKEVVKEEKKVNSPETENLSKQNTSNTKNTQTKETPKPQQEKTEPTFTPYSYFSVEGFKVGLADGWVLKQENVDEETGLKNYDFVKENYVLHIDPNAIQTSSVKGGTFSELAKIAAGPKAIIKYFPGPPCGEVVDVIIKKNLVRKDHFVGPDAHKDYEKVSCNIPSKNNVWYFSYFVMPDERYFNHKALWDSKFKNKDALFIATLTYVDDSKKKMAAEDLPAWDDKTLVQILNEAGEMVNTIRFMPEESGSK